ncbi:MAG: OmpA family protein [Saprospiraceae bacterium]|jgi:cytochrome c oxidase subunit 2|nr:OmpA family protein [Saprospiraceae bacterium]
MTYFIAFGIIFLLAVIVLQIGKLSELATKIRGEEVVERSNNDTQGKALLVFMVVFLVACVASAVHYKNQMLGYGPLTSASAHGFELDHLFNVTLFFTGIVFIITHIALFWYSYKYRSLGNKKALFFAHDTKLEMIWTVVPAVVMTYLVANGLIVWNNIFPTLTSEDKYLEIEATGYQFAWDMRYPGADGKLGNKDFRLIDPASNTLGIDWKDEASADDIVLGGADKIILPKDSTIKVRITAKDVLHSFFLPHFRVKMDAVPGIPTSFIFTPVLTTREFREQLSKFPEWQLPSDPEDPNGPKKWETFEYELACAELCGKGHYSMRRIVEVVSKEEFDTWMAGQKPFYAVNVRGTDKDPWDGKKLFPYEIKARGFELRSTVARFVDDTTGTLSNIVNLDHIFYLTGSSNLNSSISTYEMDNLVTLMGRFPKLRVELAGHTDNVGDAAANLQLSMDRATKVKEYLISKGVSPDRMTAKGYGQVQPLESNDTPEGRKKNRRTELRIISK